MERLMEQTNGGQRKRRVGGGSFEKMKWTWKESRSFEEEREERGSRGSQLEEH